MKKRTYLISAILFLSLHTAWGQTFETAGEQGPVKTNTFWSDWFVQMDLDMSLQNPYGYNFGHVFPNGKSFGLDVAVGKWFAPQVGIRGKVNWENGIKLFENHHAQWLAPFDQPGENMRKGGYIAMYGDVLLNMHNFLSGSYRPERSWNLSVYPRVGVNYNFGVSKGALLVGAGMLNTYRLNDRWSLFADLAYILSGSGFVGKTKTKGTGTGSNSNGYFSLGVGAQMNLGRSHTGGHSVSTNGFWDNWFVQVGADMSLQNPYGCNFAHVFPNGKTFGLNAAAGKWFTPEFGLRGRVNWENGLIENKSLKWLPPTDDPSENFDEHGYGMLTLDALLNFTNIIAGYEPDRHWHTSAYVRAGLLSQFALDSRSPVMGAGIEQTYRLNDGVSLFADLGYQVTTSESSASMTGMEVGKGSNGFFNIDLGVTIDLGERAWKR